MSVLDPDPVPKRQPIAVLSRLEWYSRDGIPAAMVLPAAGVDNLGG